MAERGSASVSPETAPTFGRAHIPYRTDIDGLRAIAVLPVVLFHANVRGFSGGFVGVDIFFVISGYLITSILLADLRCGDFSIARFYRRRALRILPALLVMLVVTALIGWRTLLPPEIARFDQSIAGAALFVSNLIFYWQTDYFNLGGLSWPLLHTWSLAIEEQWYLGWPLVLSLIGAGRPMTLRLVTGALILASLACCLALLRSDPPAAFYWLPARAFELGIGALLATVRVGALPRWLREAMGVAGIALIAFAIKFFTKDTLFPGLAALVPCIGAALLIASPETLVARLLALPPLRFLGWISYSLYLWHWPVIVFAEIGLFAPAGLMTALGEVVVSLLLGFASWRWIERPFLRLGWPTPRVLALAGGAIAGVAALALLGPLVAAPARFTPGQRATAAYLGFDGDGAFRRNQCFLVGPRGRYEAEECLKPEPGRRTLLLVGDSHAAHLWPGLTRAGDFTVLQATATGCVAGFYPQPANACQKMIDGVLRDWLRTHRVDRLVLSSRWQWGDVARVEAMLGDPVIRAANPVLVGPTPEYDIALPRLLVAAERGGDAGLVERRRTRGLEALDARLRAAAEHAGIVYVSALDALCPAGKCAERIAGGAPLFFDTNHFTPEASAKMGRFLLAAPPSASENTVNPSIGR